MRVDEELEKINGELERWNGQAVQLNGEKNHGVQSGRVSGVTCDASSDSRKVLPHQGVRVEHALNFSNFTLLVVSDWAEILYGWG